MKHVRGRVKHPSQPVAAEVAHHAHPVALDEVLNRCADVTERVAWLHRLDPHHQGIMGDLDQALGLPAELAGHIHPARIAEPAVDDHGHVDIQDVAVLQHLAARNAVADHVIDADAGGVLIALVSDRGRGRAGLRHHLLDPTVDLGRRLARMHRACNLVEDTRGQFAGLVHAGEILAFVKPDTVLGQTALGVVQGSAPLPVVA